MDEMKEMICVHVSSFYKLHRLSHLCRPPTSIIGNSSSSPSNALSYTIFYYNRTRLFKAQCDDERNHDARLHLGRKLGRTSSRLRRSHFFRQIFETCIRNQNQIYDIILYKP